MSASVFRRDACRLCASKSLDLALPLHPTPIADDFVSGPRAGKNRRYFPSICSSAGTAATPSCSTW